MTTNVHEAFLKLVRLGIGVSADATIPKDVDWIRLKTLSEKQGLSAIVLDGIEMLPGNQRPPQVLLLEWIGETLQGETTYSLQQVVSSDIAKLYYNNAIRMFVLKGAVVSECFPKPNHRVSVDVDCYLLPAAGFKGSRVLGTFETSVQSSKQEVQGDSWDAWSLGNDLIRAKGFNVNTDFYKNSSFDISGVNIENHHYLVPFRGNERLKKLETFFQSQFKEFNSLSVQELENSRIEDTHLYRPPVMVTALFLIEHSYSHFLHEGLTWRMVLDWMLFSKNHHDDINWVEFDAFVDEFGFRKFYDSYHRLGLYLIGEFQASSFTAQEKRMLADVWAPLDLHETVRGIKGKLALAGNTWRARWKYHHFTDMSWLTALWKQVKGFLFEKKPKLNGTL